MQHYYNCKIDLTHLTDPLVCMEYVKYVSKEYDLHNLRTFSTKMLDHVPGPTCVYVPIQTPRTGQGRWTGVIDHLLWGI